MRKIADKNYKNIIVTTGACSTNHVIDAGKILNNSSLIIMHCNSTYPMKNEDANLKYIQKVLRYIVCNGDKIGYSGHEVGMQISIAAVALGAKYIERHITLDRTMKGSDHAASLEPEGLTSLVNNIRKIEGALGNGNKVIDDIELKTWRKQSKSIVVAKRIHKGQILERDDLTVKCNGLDLKLKPKYMECLIGKVAKMTMDVDETVPLEALDW